MQLNRRKPAVKDGKPVTDNGIHAVGNTALGHKVVDDILEMYLKPEDVMAERIRQSHRANNLPEIEVSALQGKQLELLVRASKAKTALEIGTLAGYSTYSILKGLPRHGRLTSVEYETLHYTVAMRNIAEVNYGTEKTVELLHGKALEVLENELSTETFEFVFIDADKDNNLAYLEWAVRLTRTGATIVVDNVIRDGRFITRPEKLEFIRALGMDFTNTLDSTVIQTVGSKGWDGYVLAVRK